jgi:hypothetical protein
LTDQEFIAKLTAPTVNNLGFLEYDACIKELSQEPQFKQFVRQAVQETGVSKDDEQYLYGDDDTLTKELGTRISWFEALSTDSDHTYFDEGIFPLFGKSFILDDEKYWVLTCVGQGAVSWLVTDAKIKQDQEGL